MVCSTALTFYSDISPIRRWASAWNAGVILLLITYGVAPGGRFGGVQGKHMGPVEYGLRKCNVG